MASIWRAPGYNTVFDLIGKWNEKEGGWNKRQNRIGPKKKYGFDSNGVLDLIKEWKKIGLRQTVDQNLAKKNHGFKSNCVLHMIGEWKEKDGGWD